MSASGRHPDSTTLNCCIHDKISLSHKSAFFERSKCPPVLTYAPGPIHTPSLSLTEIDHSDSTVTIHYRVVNYVANTEDDTIANHSVAASNRTCHPKTCRPTDDGSEDILPISGFLRVEAGENTPSSTRSDGGIILGTKVFNGATNNKSWYTKEPVQHGVMRGRGWVLSGRGRTFPPNC